jgi:hypothetical protein
MRKLVTISAFGLEPVAWSVPRFGQKKTKSGKIQHFYSRGRKSDLANGKATMAQWQEFVRQAAVKAMAGKPPVNEPMQMQFIFYGKTPPGKRNGELWDVTVVEKTRKNKKTGKNEKYWGKKQRMGISEGDMTNIQKCTEDALQGVVYGDDVRNRMISTSAFYSEVPGVRIIANVIEEGDYPGRGEPVE